MHTLTSIFAVLFGLAFGSFLNVCISRLPAGRSVVRPPSRCPQCRASIRPLDNIPLLSWVMLRGRCRTCRAPISLRYPLVEAVIAALFLLCFLKFGLSMTGVGAAVLCFLLVGLTVMDAETLLLPDAFTLPGIALGLLFSALSGSGNGATGEGTLWSGHPRVSAMVVSVATAGVAWGLILLIRWAYWLVRRQEGMGLGDAKFMAMIGAWFGPTATFLVFLLAVVCGAIYGITVIVVARLSRARVADDLRPPVPTKVPLGAFLGLASLYTLFWGAQTLRWYFGLFL